MAYVDSIPHCLAGPGPDPIDFQEHREKMATLERPSWRKPPPPPLNKVWCVAVGEAEAVMALNPRHPVAVDARRHLR